MKLIAMAFLAENFALKGLTYPLAEKTADLSDGTVSAILTVATEGCDDVNTVEIPAKILLAATETELETEADVDVDSARLILMEIAEAQATAETTETTTEAPATVTTEPVTTVVPTPTATAEESPLAESDPTPTIISEHVNLDEPNIPATEVVAQTSTEVAQAGLPAGFQAFAVREQQNATLDAALLKLLSERAKNNAAFWAKAAEPVTA